MFLVAPADANFNNVYGSLLVPKPLFMNTPFLTLSLTLYGYAVHAIRPKILYINVLWVLVLMHTLTSNILHIIMNILVPDERT